MGRARDRQAARILTASGLAIVPGLAALPDGVSRVQFVGAACLCGVGDMLALLMADRAFMPEVAAVAKLGVLVGSILAGVIGTAVLYRRPTASTGQTPDVAEDT